MRPQPERNVLFGGEEDPRAAPEPSAPEPVPAIGPVRRRVQREVRPARAVRVLEDAGVFKRDEQGQAAFRRFAESV